MKSFANQLMQNQARSFESSQPFLMVDRDVQDAQDELLIWEKFLRGDDQSLVYIYRTYANILFRYGKQFSDKSDFVKDCIQELFCELIDNRNKLSNAQSVKGYLFACLKRKVIRDMKKREKIEFEKSGFKYHLSNTPSISQHLDEKDYSVIQSKLNGLPVAQREVIMLHFYEGLTYSEIGEIMQIKVKSARALTYRALESLQKQLVPLRHLLFTLSFVVVCLW